MSQPDHYIYNENMSKNRNGSFKQLHIKSKTVPAYACPDLGTRCPVYILDKYIGKLPPKAVVNDVLYVRPLDKVSPDPSAPWYSATPVGKHALNDKVKKMCNTASIVGHKHKCMRVVCLRSLFRKRLDTVPLKHFDYMNGQMQISIKRCRRSFQIHNDMCIIIPRDTQR